jgi:hypothetical protein
MLHSFKPNFLSDSDSHNSFLSPKAMTWWRVQDRKQQQLNVTLGHYFFSDPESFAGAVASQLEFTTASEFITELTKEGIGVVGRNFKTQVTIRNVFNC